MHCMCTAHAWHCVDGKRMGIYVIFQTDAEDLKFRFRIIFIMNSYKWKPIVPIPQEHFASLCEGALLQKIDFFLIIWARSKSNSSSSLCCGYFI